MPHTNAWNELSPAGSDLASSIDNFMRSMKLDIRERLELQHYWNSATAVGNNQDGVHKEITITPTGNNVSVLKTNSNTSVTGSGTTPLVDLAGTWNTSGVVTAVKVNMTNTASGTLSKILDLQVEGTSQFSVDKDQGIRVSSSGWLRARIGGGSDGGIGLLCNISDPTTGSVGTRGTQQDVSRPSWAIDGGGMFGADGAPWFPDSFNVLRRAPGGSWVNLLNLQFSGGVGVIQTGRVATAAEMSATHFQGGSGSAGTPTHGFFGDTNTGMFSHAADHIGFATNGTNRWEIENNGAFRPIADNTYNIGSVSQRVATLHVVAISTGTATVGGTINIPKGSLFSFATDLDTGIGSDADNNINLVGGGATVFGATYSAGALTCSIPNAAMGTGAVTGGYLEIGRNSSGNGAPGVLVLRAENGTAYVLWVDTSGKLRIHTATPKEDNSVSDTAGTIVGTQT